ncbi:Flavin-linked sulfhydryl oxidase of the mitochondrial IMS [Yamadazyma tenuis]|uniref:Sulfhydryl oxidase n=1 Tax=Candida tenuis (strain ATCC 10573 / BCRC 21748 / CBS 615 / JCM 9827 / NBRC 10315 / NRRL Y-1498 / VKM Y-70) TaxID=590646 RepID=G3B4A3_CANTC|nr:uncharacterized protein CANTEDRAFT_93441 [Yamadazyma tenuis ATCC 10573]EGV63934.1 hypothetical protein CANTEDRAFT_93441 [Yamadazyma tenuis ATCC 10573]WEJ96450.1 Flavin-linked sulfhydryl oxidase of the mitochondrial IMS [Yamadazyma tenuis]
MSSQNAPLKAPEVGISGKKIVYDKDGKPCRTCNSLLDFQMVTGKISPGAAVKAQQKLHQDPQSSTDFPPDVEQIGRSSWTLLHSIAATYPEVPDSQKQQDLKQFLKLFGNFYPCWFCADDFKSYMTKNEPKVSTQEDFGRWLCDAHNEVNVKLGKPKFDCNFWRRRWKDENE